MQALLRSFSAAAVLATIAATTYAKDMMPWQPDLETAQRLAAQTDRLVLIHFWAPWCRPCMRLETEVFSKPEVAKGLEANFVLVKLNADDSAATARLYGVSSLPTDVITTAAGRLVSSIQSPPAAAQYVVQMNQAAAGHRTLARKPPIAPATPTAAPGLPGPPYPQAAAAASAVAPAMASAPAMPGAPASAAAPQTAAPPAAPRAAGQPERYAEYYHQPPGQPAVPPSYVAKTQAYAPIAGAPAAAPEHMQPYAPPAQPAAPPAQAPANAAVSYQAPAIQLPPGCPPLGLDGTCPVTLVEQKRWALGDKTYGAVHRGRTYLFLGPAEREKFLADPDRYSPVFAGIDPVLAMDNQQTIPGRREFGMFGADGRVYLFATEESRVQFEHNEQRYSLQAVQAMQASQQARNLSPTR